MSTENSAAKSDKPKLKKTGSLWKRQSKSGSTYFSGELDKFELEDPTADKLEVVAFIRREKDKVGKDGQINPNMPDIEIFISQKRQTQSGDGKADAKQEVKATTPPSKTVSKPAAKPAPAKTDEDDLPNF